MSQSLRRILLVEDDPDIRQIARLALESVGGFEVTMYESGAEALACVVGDDPELILLDVMMPDMDGPSTLRALREIPAMRDVPAVFMTAKVQPVEVEAYLAMGAVAVIPKPFDPMSLADELRRIWSAPR